MNSSPIVVIGTGAWGTAIALSLHNAGKKVILYGRRQDFVDNLKKTRISQYLPSNTLDQDLSISSNLEDVKKASLIFWVIPVQPSLELLQTLKPYITENTPLIICSKGLELTSQKTLAELFQQQIANPIGVLSGPNFADEVAKNLPAASTLAFDDLELAKSIATSIRHQYLRIYAHDDVKGVALTGALKNIMAIAAGIVMGENLGQNCLTSLITRANIEIQRMLIALGGKKETSQTLAGIGDLILTCTSTKSRNTSFGVELAQGKTLEEILRSRMNVTEGVATAKVAYELAAQHKVHTPIINGVYDILYNKASIDTAINSLLRKQQEVEW